MNVGQNSSNTANENLVFNGRRSICSVFSRLSESILVEITNFVGFKVPFDGVTMTSVQCLGFKRLVHFTHTCTQMHGRHVVFGICSQFFFCL